LALGVGADDLLGHLAVLEHDQRRDREHLVLRGGLHVLVGVELDHLDVLALVRKLLEHGSDDTAGTAPRRPEVDQHRLLGLDDLGDEVGVGDLGDCCHVRSLPFSVRVSCGSSLYKVSWNHPIGRRNITKPDNIPRTQTASTRSRYNKTYTSTNALTTSTKTTITTITKITAKK